MSHILISAALAILGAAAVGIACRASYCAGRSRERLEIELDGHQQRITANRAASPRHAVSRPRISPDSPGQPARPRRAPNGGWVTRQDPPGTPRRRVVTTAADLAGPVFIPNGAATIPGRPQSAGYPDRDTTTMAAAVSAAISRMQRDGEQFRAEQHARAERDRAAILAAISG